MPKIGVSVGLVSALVVTGCSSRGPSTARQGPARTSPAGAPLPVAGADARPKPRSEAEIRAGLERSRRRTPHFPLLSEEEAHKAMPTMFRGRKMPSLLLVAGLQPKTMEAVMAVSRQVHTEGDLDGELLNDVFWAVSSANDCFY